VKSALVWLVWAATVWASPAAAQEAGAPPSTDGAASGSATRAEAESERTPAPARTPTSAEQARDLGRAGLSAYGQADFETALDHFRRAETLVHSPVFQLYAARSLLRLGKVDEARAELERILAATPAAGAPEAWLRARREAADELLALSSAAPVTAPRGPSDSADDFDADGHIVRVAQGVAKAPPKSPAPTAQPSPWLRQAPHRRAALVAFGVGALGLVFSAVTGGLAIAESAAVKANCDGSVCREEDLPRAQKAVVLANLATVGGVVALTGGATGTVLWLLSDAAGTPRVQVGVAGPSLRLAAHF